MSSSPSASASTSPSASTSEGVGVDTDLFRSARDELRAGWYEAADVRADKDGREGAGGGGILDGGCVMWVAGGGSGSA